MPTQTFKTTKPYATRLKKLAGRIINARYEQHNALGKIDRWIKQIEEELDVIDQRAAMRAARAKRLAAKERERELSEQAEQERIEGFEGDGQESAGPASSEGDNDGLRSGPDHRGVGAEGGGNLGVSASLGLSGTYSADHSPAGVQEEGKE